MTSALGEMCLTLSGIGNDIATTAQQLAVEASKLQQAAARAAAASRSTEPSASGAASAAQQLSIAARCCTDAAMLLTSAKQEAASYVQANWSSGGGGGGQSPTISGSGQTSSTMSVADVARWLPEINPGYTGDPADERSNNCGACALAVYQRLEGDHSAVAGAGTLTQKEMEQSTGRPQRPMSQSQIEERLRELGPGAHAVVGVDRQWPEPGHWFNAIYDGDQVYALDGQTGDVIGWPPDYGNVVYWDCNAN